MEEIDLGKYLSMAVHFVYYHHDNLYKDQTFPDDYWQHLMHISDIQYMNNIKEAIEFAFTTDDYCLSLVKSPHLERYPVEDIRLFFEKFHVFLKENLEEHSNS